MRTCAFVCCAGKHVVLEAIFGARCMSMCVCAWHVCVCVCERERERDRECVGLCVCMCVCVCVRVCVSFGRLLEMAQLRKI